MWLQSYVMADTTEGSRARRRAGSGRGREEDGVDDDDDDRDCESRMAVSGKRGFGGVLRDYSNLMALLPSKVALRLPRYPPDSRSRKSQIHFSGEESAARKKRTGTPGCGALARSGGGGGASSGSEQRGSLLSALCSLSLFTAGGDKGPGGSMCTGIVGVDEKMGGRNGRHLGELGVSGREDGRWQSEADRKPLAR